MESLFANEPFPEGLKDIWGELLILDVSMQEYWDLFWDDKATAFLDTYHKESNENNKIISVSDWFSPPEKRFRTFNGMECTKQRSLKYTMYAFILYPHVPQDQNDMICQQSDTSIKIYFEN